MQELISPKPGEVVDTCGSCYQSGTFDYSGGCGLLPFPESRIILVFVGDVIVVGIYFLPIELRVSNSIFSFQRLTKGKEFYV